MASEVMGGQQQQQQQQQRPMSGSSVIMLSQRDFSRPANTKQSQYWDTKRRSLRTKQQQQQQQESRTSNNHSNNSNNNYRDEQARRDGWNVRPLARAPSFDEQNCVGAEQQQQHHVAADSVQATGDDETQVAAGELLQQPTAAKHSVGPVMGIFFKVWSLVKVTRGRHHHNKMRRQGSEDAGQFRYISGDQMATSSRSSAHSAQEAPTVKGEHFRRAGSQPAPGLAASEQGGGALRHGSRSINARLQVTPTPPPGALTGATTTTSSSSGVSSGSCGLTSGGRTARYSASGAIVEPATRHATTPTQRRSAEPLGGANLAQAAASRAQSEARPVPSRGPALEQQQPRARQRRAASQDESAAAAAAQRNGGGSSKRSPPNSANGAGNGRKDATTNGGLELTRCNEHADDSDANEIFSTPNDSIQSVVSAEQAAGSSGEQAQSQLAANCNGQSSGQTSQKMIKSLSSNNFAQLVRQAGGDRSKLGRRAAAATNGTDSLIAAGASNQEERLSGSRFFISSSSSEDSNPSSKQQQQQQQQQQNCSPRNNVPLDKTQTQLPLRLGVHQHNGAGQMAPRPDALCLGPANGNGWQAVAAMSPSLGQAEPPSVAWNQELDNSMRAFGQYKKSPSLYEMSHRTRLRATSYLHGAQAWPPVGPPPPPPPVPPVVYANQDAIALDASGPDQIQAFPYHSRPIALNDFQPVAGQNGGAKTKSTKATITASTPTQTTTNKSSKHRLTVPSSVSLHDCKLSSFATGCAGDKDTAPQFVLNNRKGPSLWNSMTLHSESELMHAGGANLSDCSEYKLTQMLLKFGSDLAAKDEHGNTVLMHSIMSDNLAALKCLIEQSSRLDLDQVNHDELSALDLVCQKESNELRIEMLELLIEANADLDKTRKSDGTRLLDRLIRQHQPPQVDKIPYIDSLLHYGAKLSSSTWAAAQGKFEIQLRLLRKLAKDGYFLYKKSAIEEAVYRFEYALKRIDELEQQLDNARLRLQQTKLISGNKSIDLINSQLLTWAKATQQIKYQTYIGLSRCELILCS